MKQLLVLLALALALPVAGWADELTAQQSAGQKVFAHRCGMCHREGGTGTFVLARRLGAAQSLLEQRTDLKPEYIRYVVRWGLVNMPRLSRVEVPDPDMNQLVAYLTRPRPAATP
ncbi:MAG: cytochrome c [Proteobacteria bacterium]|nr:cytochrome c [Pseudomonadota bacterium]